MVDSKFGLERSNQSLVRYRLTVTEKPRPVKREKQDQQKESAQLNVLSNPVLLLLVASRRHSFVMRASSTCRRGLKEGIEG